MNRNLNMKQFTLWTIVGIYLLIVPISYHLTLYSDNQVHINKFLLLLVIIPLNIFLSLWVIRNKHSKETVSFISVLLLFSGILFTYNSNFPSTVWELMSLFISLFPTVFFVFFVYFINDKGFSNKRSKYCALILFVIALLEVLLSFTIFNLPSSILLFFSGLSLLMLFCVRHYIFSRKTRSLNWASDEVRTLLIVTFGGIAPFVVFSLLPSIFGSQASIENTWSLYTLLLIPAYVGNLLSKHNLIVHQYWKLSFMASYYGVIGTLSIISLIIYSVLNPPVVLLITAIHYLVFTGYVIYIGIIVYTENRKNIVKKKLDNFHEEQHSLTFYQLKNKILEQEFTQVSNHWEEKWNADNICLYEYYTEIDKKNLLFSNNNNNDFSDQTNNKKENVIMSDTNTMSYKISIYREEAFKSKKRRKIRKEINNWIFFLEEQKKLLSLKHKLEDRSYTSLEKAIYFREMKLADVYHEMISRYLHDDVQQYLYYMKQMVFTETSITSIRSKMEDIIDKMEKSIRLRTIEWMNYPETNKEIDHLIYELSQTLEKNLSTEIIIDMDIDVISFERESNDIKNLLYRITKECMVNSYKHSKASNMYISINKAKNSWHLVIKDDGIGWDGDLHSTTRFGLASIHRQVESIGGNIDIQSSIGSGFKINIQLTAEEF